MVLVVVMVMILVVVVMVVLLHDHYLRLGRWLRIDYLRLGCIVDRRRGLVWLVRKLLILVGSVVWSIALVCVHFINYNYYYLSKYLKMVRKLKLSRCIVILVLFQISD